MRSDLLQQFDEAMLNIYRTAEAECNYRPTIFMRMLSEHGSLYTAKDLVLRTKPSDGYTRLYELGRLDLTVEALIIREPWRQLFSAEILAAAEKRLCDYEYKFPK
jgi:hypothetical protein